MLCKGTWGWASKASRNGLSSVNAGTSVVELVDVWRIIVWCFSDAGKYWFDSG